MNNTQEKVNNMFPSDCKDSELDHELNFGEYDFLKAYEKCYKMSYVSTLAVGAFRSYGAKS